MSGTVTFPFTTIFFVLIVSSTVKDWFILLLSTIVTELLNVDGFSKVEFPVNVERPSHVNTVAVSSCAVRLSGSMYNPFPNTFNCASAGNILILFALMSKNEFDNASNCSILAVFIVFPTLISPFRNASADCVINV